MLCPIACSKTLQMGQRSEAFWNQDMGFRPYETEFSGTDEVMQPLEGPVHFTPCFLEAPSQEYGQWELLLLTFGSNGGNPGIHPLQSLTSVCRRCTTRPRPSRQTHIVYSRNHNSPLENKANHFGSVSSFILGVGQTRCCSKAT